MPFMIGSGPVRRTLEHLRKCNIVFRENVRIFFIAYGTKTEWSAGARDLVYWNFAQIQFRNQTVQCLSAADITPTPFIKIYRENDEPVLIDLDSRSRFEILDLLENLHIVTKTKDELKKETSQEKNKNHPSYFGYGCERHCICEVPGQLPCTALVKLPNHWRGIPPKVKKVFIPPYIEKWAQEHVAKLEGTITCEKTDKT